MDLLNTILLIAFRNNLSHIIIFSDVRMPKGNHTVYNAPSAFIQVVDISCAFLSREINSSNGYVIGRQPVLNIAIHCPGMSLQDKETEVLRKDGHRIERAKHEHDMLIQPFLNVILLGMKSSSIPLLEFLRQRRGIQRLLLVDECCAVLESEQLFNAISCLSCIIRDVHGTTVAMVTAECDYRAKRRLLTEQFEGFKGRAIHVITQEEFALSEKRIEGGRLKWSGYAFEVLNYLADVLDFRYNVETPVNAKYGGKHENGSGYGMIGMLMRKETDMIAGLITRTPQRMSIVDMVVPIYNDRTILTIYVNAKEKWALFFLRPYLPLVYPLLLACVILVPSVLMLLAKYGVHPETTSNWGLLGIGLFFAKGIPFRGYSTPLRIVVIFTSLGVLPLIACYSGALVASFATQKPILPFEDLKGAVEENNGFSYYIGNGGGSYDFITNSKDSTIKALSKKLDPVTYDVIKQGYASGKEFIGIINSEIWKYTITKGKSGCNWHVIEEAVFKVDHTFALPKGSPFSQVFSERIQRLIELGFLEKWKRHYFRSNVLCGNVKTKRTLPLADFKEVFIILLIGLVAGLFALILELRARRKRDKH